MAARTTRREARERIIKSFMDSLDRIIPPDEQVPLRGRTFLDWERQADAMRKAVLPTLLQERAALDDSAAVEARAVGKCPRCGSGRVYLDHDGREVQKEVISPHGPVVIAKQQCRCRNCGRSFSPSGS
jgi:ribosomal protein S27AE